MDELREDVEQLVNIGAWRKVLTINEPAYRELTFEFLTTFERLRDRDVSDEAHAIHFQLKGQDYHLIYTKFALFMGIYDQDYTLIEEYRNLLSSHPLGNPISLLEEVM